MALTRRKLKRLLARPVARPRREMIWRQVLRRAAEQGFAEQELERFYDYFSVNLRLEKPQYVNALQKPGNYFPGLEARPTHDPSSFSWSADLVHEFAMIRDELLKHSSESTLDKHPQKLTDRGRWNVLYFFAGGQQVEAVRDACRRTSEIIQSIPGTGQAGNTYLSVLQPGTHIQRHFGPTNTRLRCHLGIAVPQGARMRVGSEMCQWREGECLIFDDSFDHEVWNDSDKERVVLIIDFWHPDLTPAERWAIDVARRLRFGLSDFPPTSSSRRTVAGRAG